MQDSCGTRWPPARLEQSPGAYWLEVGWAVRSEIAQRPSYRRRGTPPQLRLPGKSETFGAKIGHAEKRCETKAASAFILMLSDLDHSIGQRWGRPCLRGKIRRSGRYRQRIVCQDQFAIACRNDIQSRTPDQLL